MQDQLFETLVAPPKSAGQRLTERRARLLAQGRHPATSLELLDDERTCGDCANAVKVLHSSRSYWKCGLVPITRGAGSDIRVGWPACTAFQEGS